MFLSTLFFVLFRHEETWLNYFLKVYRLLLSGCYFESENVFLENFFVKIKIQITDIQFCFSKNGKLFKKSNQTGGAILFFFILLCHSIFAKK